MRMALGATRGDVLRLVIGQGMRVVVVGAIIGITGSLLLARLMATLLYSVRPMDPGTFVVVTMLLGAVALVACYVPALRATRIDPMSALRAE